MEMDAMDIVNKDELAQHPLVKHLRSTPAYLMEAILKQVQESNIQIKDFICDHLCWRCASLEEYIKIKSLFASEKDCDGLGFILVECMIGGRPISTIHLNSPILIKTNSNYNFTIPAFELPCPKPGRDYESGWEHCEFAVSNQFSKLEDFVGVYENRIQFDYRAYKKKFNNDVSLEFNYIENGQKKTGQVKFHLLPLEEVVKQELSEGDVEFVPENYFFTP